MAMCEDFPCCGHEMGCCPRFENGVQMDMVCVCGARLPVDNPTSICNGCLRRGMIEEGFYEEDEFADEDDFCEDDADCGMEDEWLDSYMEDRMGGGGEF